MTNSCQSLGWEGEATQPDADETARAASLKPGWQVRTRLRRSDVFKDVGTGDITEDGFSQEESPCKCKNIKKLPLIE